MESKIYLSEDICGCELVHHQNNIKMHDIVLMVKLPRSESLRHMHPILLCNSGCSLIRTLVNAVCSSALFRPKFELQSAHIDCIYDQFCRPFPWTTRPARSMSLRA